MKRMLSCGFLIGAVLSICVTLCWAAGDDDNSIDLEMLERASRNYVRVIYHDANYSSPIPEKTKQDLTLWEERFFKLRITSLLLADNFEAAFNIPMLVRSRLDTDSAYSSYHASYTGGIIVDRRDFILKMINNLSSFTVSEVQNILTQFTTDKKFDKAVRLASAFAAKDNAQSSRWLNEIRDQATIEVENVARVIQALTSFPNLQIQERAKALAIINAFPGGDARRAHIQGEYDAIIFAPVPAVPSASALEFSRRVADSF